jgi:putative two-component system response regulator
MTELQMEKKSILVVDDAPENIDLLVGLLKDKYKVRAALNGEVALTIARSPSPPDLILLDIVMPGMDGLEVCETLKGDEGTSHIPIVFLSGQASGEECERGMEIGGEAYLQKPVEPESLFSILEITLP